MNSPPIANRGTIAHNNKIHNMTNFERKNAYITRNLILIILTFQISSCIGQVKEKSVTDKIENEVNPQPPILNQKTIFLQKAIYYQYHSKTFNLL